MESFCNPESFWGDHALTDASAGYWKEMYYNPAKSQRTKYLPESWKAFRKYILQRSVKWDSIYLKSNWICFLCPNIFQKSPGISYFVRTFFGIQVSSSTWVSLAGKILSQRVCCPEEFRHKFLCPEELRNMFHCLEKFWHVRFFIQITYDIWVALSGNILAYVKYLWQEKRVCLSVILLNPIWPDI